jgi:t-SNARE complex subunit (syntaxin)
MKIWQPRRRLVFSLDVTASPRTDGSSIQSRGGTLAQDLLTPDLDLRQRDRELTEIAKNIASLAELFKDLSALVIDQGTLLDSVEYNIEQTAVQMSEAVKELDMATRYARVPSAIGYLGIVTLPHLIVN